MKLAHKTRGWLLAAFGLLACLARPANAQPAAPPPQAEGRVQLDVVVTDAAGKPVGGLKAQDFTLLDENQPCRIVSFHAYDAGTAKPDPPVQVILVFDTLNNDFNDIGLIRQGMEQFLRENGGHLAQPVSIELLTVPGVAKIAGPSTDGNALADVVDKIKASIPPKGVFTFSISLLAMAHIAQEQGKKTGRKMLIWPGRGWQTPGSNENQDVFTQKDERDRLANFNGMISLSTELREARITLYGGYLNSAFYQRAYLKVARKVTDFDPRSLSLGALSLASGGRGSSAYRNGESDLPDQLNAFMADANTFYTVTFDPPPAQHPDEYRDLNVLVAGAGLVVHTKAGYYNEPDLSKPVPVKETAPPSKIVEQVKAFAPQPVSVVELEGIVKTLARKTDSEAAKELFRLALTERLSSETLALWLADLRGVKARAALTALADASAFLSLPPAEIPDRAAPDLAVQRRIVSLAVSYLGKTIPKLPDFYATRTTLRFDDTRDDTKHPGRQAPTGEPLHEAGASKATVVYRDGKEVVDPVAQNGAALGLEKGLVTRGTFGPILSMAMVDASRGRMTFNHWEQRKSGLDAVFAFVVSQDKSHYQVAYQSPADMDQGHDMQQYSAYHGEVAINQATGTIDRLEVVADVGPNLSIEHADVMVEYGPVDIGGKTYTCPVRSVSLSKGRAVVAIENALAGGTTLGPDVTRLSDVTFTDYHVFRAEMRILPEGGATQ